MHHLLAVLASSPQESFKGGQWNAAGTHCTFSVRVNGKRLAIGRFDKVLAESGAEQYDCIKLLLFGSKASTNFTHCSYSQADIVDAAEWLQSRELDVPLAAIQKVRACCALPQVAHALLVDCIWWYNCVMLPMSTASSCYKNSLRFGPAGPVLKTCHQPAGHKSMMHISDLQACFLVQPPDTLLPNDWWQRASTHLAGPNGLLLFVMMQSEMNR
jgi:hypothetical protein